MLGRKIPLVSQNLQRLLGTLLSYTRLNNSKVPVFIVGCQRSGTTMLDRVLTRSPQIKTYGEGRGAFSPGVRLLPIGNLHYLIYRSLSPIVEFKPLNDTQHIDYFLKIHPNSKAIWMYRNYFDVINSMVRKWGRAQNKHVHQIATGRYSGPGARAMGERISPANRELAAKLEAQDLSEHEASAFIWYLRNSIYFDRQLDRLPNVLLCKYEDMVTEPKWQFQRVFEFIDGDFSADYVADVRSSSISKHKPPTLRTNLKSLCDSLMEKLDEQYCLQLTKNQIGD